MQFGFVLPLCASSYYADGLVRPADEDLDFALKLEHRLTEKALHGRILGHRERRKLRRQIARVVPTIVKVEAEAQPAVAMDVDGSATEDEDCGSARLRAKGS